MSRKAAPPADDRINYASSEYAPSEYAPSEYAPSEYAPSEYAPSEYAPSMVEVSPSAPSSYAASERYQLTPPPPSLSPVRRPPPTSRSSGSAGFDLLISTLRGVPEVSEVPAAPESTHAESVYPDAVVSRPAVAVKHSKKKPPVPAPAPAPAPRRPPQDEDLFKAQYYKAAPASRKVPERLHNQHCGARYKTVAAIKRWDAELLKRISESEVMVLMQVLATVYFYRMNAIPSKNALSDGAIRGLFDCDITDFQFSINEVYKRLAMRKGRLAADVGCYNFWKLSATEMERFIDWLREIGTWVDTEAGIHGAQHTLWTFGKDDPGKMYLKIKRNPATLNWIQLLNSLYDSLVQWKRMSKGAAYIQSLKPSEKAEFDFS